MRRFLLTALSVLTFNFLFAQDSIEVYPTSWWVGMKNPKLQLMLHGVDVGLSNVSLSYPGVTINKVNKVENKKDRF